MSVLFLKVNYGQKVLDGSFNASAVYGGYGFDTTSKAIVPVNGTWRGAFLEPVPADVDVAEDQAFYFDCANASAANEYEGVGYFHVRSQSSFRTEPVPQCVACGYTPPVTPAPTCELMNATAVVAGDQVTLSATGNRGPLRFSLDDGLTQQSGGTFRRLRAGDYTGTIVDTGTPDCRIEVSFTIEGADGPLADLPFPVGAPQSLELAHRQIWEVISGLASGTRLRLELWMESRHQAGDYTCIYRSDKVAARDGTLYFRLDQVLLRQLEHELPALDQNVPTFVDKPIRNYFCRTKELDYSTGQERNPVNRPLRTVLLAGLEPGADFLTTQPLTKTVAPLQPELLYFLSPKQVSSTISVHRTVVLTNGLSSEEVDTIGLTEDGGSARYRLLCIPVLAGLPVVGVARVAVQVLDQLEQPLTPIRQYQLADALPGRPRRVVLFDNPVGGIDTLVATGNGRSDLDVKTETADLAPLPSDTIRTPSRFVWQAEETRKHRAGTGYLTAAQQRWLQAFMRSRQVWLLTPAGLVPLLLSSRKLSYVEDERDAKGLTFEYELASEAANWNELR